MASITSALGAVRPTATAVTLSARLANIPLQDAAAASRSIAGLHAQPEDFSAAFVQLKAASPAQAGQFAAAFTASLQSTDQVARFYDVVSRSTEADRRAVVEANRTAGQGAMLVHGVAMLPAAQGRALMKDFLAPGGVVNDAAAVDVAQWLIMAGQVMREKGMPLVEPAHDLWPFDEIVEGIKSLGDALVGAIKSAFDAVVNAVGDIAGAIAKAVKDIAQWTAQQLGDFIRAVLSAGKTVGELIGGALQASFDAMKKMVQGIIAIGRTLADVVNSALTLAAGVLTSVLRALRDLGQNLTSFMGYLVGKAVDVIRRTVEALIAIGEQLANILSEAIRFGVALVSETVRALIALGRSVGQILVAAVTGGNVLDAVVGALRQLGQSFGSLLDTIRAQAIQLLRNVAASIARVAGTLVDLAVYAANAAINVAREIVAGVLAAGRILGDLIQHVVQQGLAAVRKLVDAAFQLGRSLLQVMGSLFNLALDGLKLAVRAMIDLGKTVAEFSRALLSSTLDLARKLVQAAIEAGIAAATLLASAISAGFLVFRRVLNAVLRYAGPLGDVVNWILTQVEDVASLAWRELIDGMRAAGRAVGEVLEWARRVSEATLRQVIAALNAAGTVVSEILAWARSAGAAALELAGEMLRKAGHAVDYVLLWVEKSAVEVVAAVVRGLLRAGATLAELVAWAASRTLEAARSVVQAALSFGATLAQIIADTLAHPQNILRNIVQALKEAGQTLSEILQAAVVQPIADAARRVVTALKELGETAKNVFVAALEAGGSVVAVVFTLLLEWFPGSYRSLTDAERTTAASIFGTSIPLDEVRIAVKSLLVDFIESVNNARPFTTMFLINFASWDKVEIGTLVHEMTHVWQGVQSGPIYMVEALEAQISEGNPEAYNYGFTNASNGDGGEDELAAAGGDFGQFNREQQAKIIEHFFVRREASLDTTAWQPYADLVHA